MKSEKHSLSQRPSVLWLLALPPLLAVGFSFILPYAASFWNARSAFGIGAMSGTGDAGISIWENEALFNITAFTIRQAFFSVLLSLALGLPGAWFIGNSKSRFVPILRTLSAVPFAMPSILVVLGFVLFFGNSGWLNQFIVSIWGEERWGSAPLRILYRPEAIILAHGFFNFPLVVRLAGDGLSRARRAYAPAAASLGASPIVTVFTVILPLALPGILSAAFLVFLYSFTSFAVVLVLGGGPSATTLAVEIYRHARIFLNYNNAAALALIETTIAVSAFMAFAYFGKKSREIKTDLQDRMIDVQKRKLPGRVFLFIYAAIAGVFILGPIISIIAESFLHQSSRAAAQELTLRWWTSLGDTWLPSLFRSLFLAFSAATLSCILASMAAGFVKLQENSFKANSGKANAGKTNVFPVLLVKFISASPIISSGIVLGLGWLIIYGRTFSRTPLALILLHSVAALPFAFNSISEGLRSLPANTLNAAAVFGANPVKGLLTVALPLSLKRIRSAWGFAAALSLGELNAAMMLGMEGWETLPLFIYRAAGAYRYGIACAAGSLLILCCAGCFLISDMGIRAYET